MRKSRRGFTLIELVTYLTLLSTSLVLLLSFEMASQQASAEQCAALDIARSSDALYERLRSDVIHARSIRFPEPGSLEIKTKAATITYKLNLKRHTLTRRSGESQDNFPRIRAVEFRFLNRPGPRGATLLVQASAFQGMEVKGKELTPYGPEWSWRFESLIGAWRTAR